MNADFEDTAHNQSPAFATFAYDLLKSLLADAAHPAQLNRQLVKQLREITGARLAILARQREREGRHELAAFEPERRRPLAESPALMALADMTCDLDGPLPWEGGEAPPDVAALLEESLPGPAVAVPLRVEKLHVGALLLFGLPQEQVFDQVIAALDTLSPVVALVFRIVSLFEDQEATIAVRTRELAESKERMEVTLRSIGDAVIATNTQGRITFINPVAEQLTGWTEAEAAGKPLDEVFHIVNMETHHEVENPVARVLHEGGGLANHTLLIAKDGREIPIAYSGAPIRSAQGEITGVVLVFRDQTEERATQKALWESEEKYRSLFEGANDSIFIIDLDTRRFLDVNQNAARRLGYSREELLRLTNDDIDTPMAAARNEAIIQELQERNSVVFEHAHRRKDGTEVPIEISSRVVEYGGRRVLQSIVRDITERKRAEEALKESEARFRDIFENATIGLYRTTPSGRILMANSALVRMLGYSSFEELAQRDLSKEGYVSEYPRSVFRQRIESEGQVIGLESAWVRRDGTTLFVRESARAIRDEARNTLYYEGSVEDITARKRSEATWQALNAAAVALQQTAPSETEIYEAASEQLAALGLRGAITLLDEATDSFAFEHLIVPPSLLTALERLTGLTGTGLRIPRARIPVFAQAVESGQALYIANSATHIVAKLLPESISRLAGQVTEMLGPANAILAPLRVKGRVGGLLYVSATWLTAADVPAITAFADQMSAALENAWLYSQTKRRATALAILNQVGQTINSTLQFDDLLQTIYQQVTRVMDTTSFYIALYDEQENEIHFKFAVEEGRRQEEVRRRFGIGLTEYLILSRKPLLIADNVEETCQQLGIEPVGKPATSWLGSPLIASGKAIGAIAIQSYKAEETYDEEHLEFLSTIAAHAAVAIENAWLYEAARRRAEETEALLATTQAISCLRLDEVLETIAGRARALFKADGSRIHLIEPDGETLRCVVALHERAEAALTATLKLGEGITGRVALKGAPEIVNQALADSDMLQMPGTPVEQEALALVPLKARGQVIGVMTVTRLGEERPFAQADLTFLTAFANQAALAIENARLYRETQQLAAFNRSIIQSMAEGIVVQDADGIFTFANPAAATMLGYAPAELVGLHWSAITPSDQQPVILLADERRRRGEAYRYELELVRKDGKKIVVLVSGVPRVDMKGQFAGTMSVFTDITARKRAAEALREYSERLEEMVKERTQELQDAQERLIRQERLAVLGQLAGGVGHELRNPLGVITNAIYYLNMVMPDADAKVKEYLELIQTNTQEAARIVSELLNFARVRSVDRAPAKVSEMVVAVMAQHPAPANVTIKVDIPEELPAVLVAPAQIKQVLTNLVINAYQAMPEGGAISIQASVIGSPSPADCSPITDACLLITVRDTGPGIAPENMDKIFEPLFTTKARGIGLGLALCKMLVEANHGRIKVESALGQGATFNLYLPVK